MASTASVSSACAGTKTCRQRKPPKTPARRWPGSNWSVRRSCRTVRVKASLRDAALHGIGEGLVGDAAIGCDGQLLTQSAFELFQFVRRHGADQLPGRPDRHDVRFAKIVEA